MCRFSEVIHKNGTNECQNGTTALARVRQNGTVPCRCAVVPSVPFVPFDRQAEKRRLESDPRFAAWVAGSK